MTFPSGNSEDPGPRVAGGVLESSQGHGGLLYPRTAQRNGVLHPVCEDTVGGSTQTRFLWEYVVSVCDLFTVNSRLVSTRLYLV